MAACWLERNVRGSHRLMGMTTFSVVTVATALGCTGLDPVQPASGGSWYVGYHTGWGPYNEADEMSKAIKAASDFCLARGQHMSVIDSHSRPGGVSMSYASVHFRCTTQPS